MKALDSIWEFPAELGDSLMEIVALIEQILEDYWQRMERALEGLTPAELEQLGEQGGI